jgi:hypothetical protein
VIQVAKVPKGYIAHATPPHVKTEWRSTKPLLAKALIAVLVERGAHQTDIGDALYAADPDWLQNSN